MCWFRNPLFPHKLSRYELTPDKVGCVPFCSKNYAPILSRLHEITGRFHTFENFRLHGPVSPLLLGTVKPGDTLTQGVQRSFQKGK